MVAEGSSSVPAVFAPGFPWVDPDMEGGDFCAGGQDVGIQVSPKS